MTLSDDTEPNESNESPADAAGDVEPVKAVDTRYGVVVTESRGQAVLHPTVDQWLEVATAARDDGFDQLVDVTAVDFSTYAGHRPLPESVAPERFEVVASLLSHERRERIRMRVQVPADRAEVATLFDVWPGAETLEREVFDMFGISFTDHPDLSRILMPEDWDGYPLRKDYDTGAIPVQFKAATNVR